MKYRMGWPLWKLFAKFGATIVISVKVFEDKKAGVLIATSPDLPGLICEEKHLTDLKESIEVCAVALLEEQFKEHKAPTTSMAIAVA